MCYVAILDKIELVQSLGEIVTPLALTRARARWPTRAADPGQSRSTQSTIAGMPNTFRTRTTPSNPDLLLGCRAGLGVETAELLPDESAQLVLGDALTS